MTATGRAVVLIPFAGDDPARRRALDYVVRCWQALDCLPWVCNGQPGQPWSKGSVLRAQWSHIFTGPVVVADADVIPVREAAERTLELIRDGVHWACPHDTVHRLDEASSRQWITANRRPRLVNLVRAAHPAMLGGGVVMLDPEAWRAVPIDPRFVGWGGEDEAWGLALSKLIGPPVLGHYPLVHLWHPHAAPKRPRYRWPERAESCDLLRRYRAADTAERMAALVAEYRCL